MGLETCFECYEEVQVFWDVDKHHKVWDTFVENGKIFDLECVFCYIIGYGKFGGSILGVLKNFKIVQCESCYGLGSIYVEDEDPDFIQCVVVESVCVMCYNEKHFMGFQYDVYCSKFLVLGYGW